MVNQQLFTDKINSFVAKITSSIPDEIDIGQDLYLYGWLYKAITTTDSYTDVPLKVALKSDIEEWAEICDV